MATGYLRWRRKIKWPFSMFTPFNMVICGKEMETGSYMENKPADFAMFAPLIRAYVDSLSIP